LSVG
jgi:hypothetical protein